VIGGDTLFEPSSYREDEADFAQDFGWARDLEERLVWERGVSATERSVVFCFADAGVTRFLERVGSGGADGPSPWRFLECVLLIGAATESSTESSQTGAGFLR
jgi:hypothetical protein